MSKKYAVNAIGETHRYGKFQIIAKHGNEVEIRFFNKNVLGLHSTRIVKKSSVHRKTIRDPYAPTVYKVAATGCIATDRDKQTSMLYVVWIGMVRRCYDKKHTSYKYYGGAGITVQGPDFLCFERFCETAPTLPGFDKDKFLAGRLQIDKDLKQADKKDCEKVYSAGSCCWVKAGVNQQHKGKYRGYERNINYVFVAVHKVKKIFIAFTNVSKFCKKWGDKSSNVNAVLNNQPGNPDSEWHYFRTREDDFTRMRRMQPFSDYVLKRMN